MTTFQIVMTIALFATAIYCFCRLFFFGTKNMRVETFGGSLLLWNALANLYGVKIALLISLPIFALTLFWSIKKTAKN